MRAINEAAAAVAISSLFGCFYSPSARDCAVTCGSGDTCPSGTSCVDGVCRVDGAEGKCTSEPRCGWAVYTNFDPCALPSQEHDWIVTSNGTYATDSGRGGEGYPGQEIAVGGNLMARIVHVRHLEVHAGVTLTIGSDDGKDRLPLLVVAETAMIAGAIVVRSGRDQACAALPIPAEDADCGAGGSGGGFSGSGGSGGGNVHLAASGRTPAAGNAMVAPLQGGCSGSPGGVPTSATSQEPAPAGPGGGGIQISARDSLMVTGTINANGTGGGRAQGYVGGCGVGCRLGGAGGGSGGAIVLEAAALQIGGTARLCANGGGGGGGAFSTPQLGYHGEAAPVVVCDSVPARGGSNAGPAQYATMGGQGGYGSSVNGTDGASNQTGILNSAGAGGGGSAGRIRIHASNATPVADGAVVTPVAWID